MDQLKMIMTPVVHRESVTELPLGYTFSQFSGDEREVQDWLNICSYGLLPDKEMHWFYEAIRDYPHLDTKNDLFFVSCGGERVATFVAMVRPNREGYVHMVAALPKCRGIGVGNAMTAYAVKLLSERGCESITLTTDDFRLAAIKTYINAGFEPVIDSEEMKVRWEDVLSHFKA